MRRSSMSMAATHSRTNDDELFKSLFSLLSNTDKQEFNVARKTERIRGFSCLKLKNQLFI